MPMSPRARRTVIPYAVLALALTVAGCTGDGGGGGGRSSSSSPYPSMVTTVTTPPSSSSTSTAPTLDLPEKARKHTHAGAKAFAGFFLTEVNRSYTTLDLTALNAMAASKGCKTCAAVTRDIRRMQKAGVHVREDRYTVTDSQVMSTSELSALDVDVLGEYRAGAIIDASGKVVQRLKSKKSWLRVALRWTASGWHVSEFATVTR